MGKTFNVNAIRRGQCFDLCLIAQQDRIPNTIIKYDLCSFQDFQIICFCKNNSLRVLAGLIADDTHYLVIHAEPFIQVGNIFIPVL